MENTSLLSVFMPYEFIRPRKTLFLFAFFSLNCPKKDVFLLKRPYWQQSLQLELDCYTENVICQPQSYITIMLSDYSIFFVTAANSQTTYCLRIPKTSPTDAKQIDYIIVEAGKTTSICNLKYWRPLNVITNLRTEWQFGQFGPSKNSIPNTRSQCVLYSLSK